MSDKSTEQIYKSTEQIFWELDAFIKCSVFSPPEDAIQNAHELLVALRQRHAEAVEKAYREGFEAAVEWSSAMCADKELVDTYWEASEAKKKNLEGA